MSPARCSALAPGGGVTAFTSPPTKKLPWLPITSGRSAAPAAEQTPRDATTAHTDASLRKPMKAPLFLSTREYARGPAPCHLVGGCGTVAARLNGFGQMGPSDAATTMPAERCNFSRHGGDSRAPSPGRRQQVPPGRSEDARRP